MENLALENLLKELSQQAQMALDVAVDAQQRAASAVVGVCVGGGGIYWSSMSPSTPSSAPPRLL